MNRILAKLEDEYNEQFLVCTYVKVVDITDVPSNRPPEQKVRPITPKLTQGAMIQSILETNTKILESHTQVLEAIKAIAQGPKPQEITAAWTPLIQGIVTGVGGSLWCRYQI